MRHTITKALSLLGISVITALQVAAQDAPKAKVTDQEAKYKSEYAKTKEEKNEIKDKSPDLKVKDEKKETKIKGVVRPMRVIATETAELKTGETNVKVQEHVTPLPVTTKVVSEQPVVEQVPVTKPVTTTVVAKKKVYRKNVAAVRKPNTGVKYVVRTKVVRDTVFVPSAPERIVTTETEYVHDTVIVTRVDTVEKTQKVNTYTGYSVPRGNFKKVILTKDRKTGEVKMKRKEDNR